VVAEEGQGQPPQKPRPLRAQVRSGRSDGKADLPAEVAARRDGQRCREGGERIGPRARQGVLEVRVALDGEWVRVQMEVDRPGPASLGRALVLGVLDRGIGYCA